MREETKTKVVLNINFLEIDSFCRGAASQLKTILRSVTFKNMHNVLPFRMIKENALELTKLADHLLEEKASLELMIIPGVPLGGDWNKRDSYCQSRMSCTSGLELSYPVTLDAFSNNEADTQ